MTSFHNNSRGGIWPIFIVIGIFLFTSYLASSTLIESSVDESGESLNIDNAQNYEQKQSVQIAQINFSQQVPTATLTPLPTTQTQTTPTPSIAYCPRHSPKLPTCECPPDEWLDTVCDYPRSIKMCQTDADCPAIPTICEDGECYGNEPASPCIQKCWGKPVIYLYPEEPTFVDVTVTTNGRVFVSDPFVQTYLTLPTVQKFGWSNVLAHPSGELIYKGKSYKELFYETDAPNFKKPESGIEIPTQELRPQLDTILTRLGLIDHEKEEFIEYWVPRLEELKTPSILFSLLDTEEKEKVDSISYNPKPTTRIEFLVYFRGLNTPFKGPSLELPTSPPQRIGFTAVEWGGTIE